MVGVPCWELRCLATQQINLCRMIPACAEHPPPALVVPGDICCVPSAGLMGEVWGGEAVLLFN